MINGFNYGLTKFLTLTVRNSAGKVAAAETIPFCPDTYDRNGGPGSPRTTVPAAVPHQPVSAEHGVGGAKGWAADPAESDFPGHQTKLPLGVYQVAGTITPEYTRLFRIPARDATTTVKLTVVKGPRCCPIPGCCIPGQPTAARSRGPAAPGRHPGHEKPAAVGPAGPGGAAGLGRSWSPPAQAGP